MIRTTRDPVSETRVLTGSAESWLRMASIGWLRSMATTSLMVIGRLPAAPWCYSPRKGRLTQPSSKGEIVCTLRCTSENFHTPSSLT